MLREIDSQAAKYHIAEIHPTPFPTHSTNRCWEKRGTRCSIVMSHGARTYTPSFTIVVTATHMHQARRQGKAGLRATDAFAECVSCS
jgi:hypothetical protein